MPQKTFSSSSFRPRSDRAGFKPDSLTTRSMNGSESLEELKVDCIRPVVESVFAIGHVDHAGLEADVQIWAATLAIRPPCCPQAYEYCVYLFTKELDEKVTISSFLLTEVSKLYALQRWALPFPPSVSKFWC